jgi:hypothetical protein
LARHALMVVAFDSQLKWAMSLAGEFEARGWRYSVVVPAETRSALSTDQLAAAGLDDVQRVPWRALLARARLADCVVLALQGTLVARFTDELAVLRRDDPAGREPVVVAGWVGIIIEKLVAGYLDRAGADVVAVNSADNLRAFTDTGRWLGIPPDNLLLSGLPLLPARPEPAGTGPIRTVLFADQPTVPKDRWDRAYVYQRLLDYAHAHPDRRVLLKPRHRPEEGTFHVMQDHPETVLRRLGPAPANFAVVYDSVTTLLPTTDLVLTVSSTAGLEAIGAGVRTVFVADLGIHEKHGNQVLVESGLVASFADVIDDRIPQANPAWLEDVFVGGDLRPTARIVARVEDLVDVDPARRPSRTVAADRYLSGRVAVRELRRGLPSIARDPADAPRGTGRWQPVLLSLARRGDHLLRGLLPGSWHRAALNVWRSLPTSVR